MVNLDNKWIQLSNGNFVM